MSVETSKLKYREKKNENKIQKPGPSRTVEQFQKV